jgi:hypothetical protein
VIGGVIFMVSEDVKEKRHMDDVNGEIADLQSKVFAVNANIHLTESEVDKYTNIMNQLIPDKEDYFSILYALEMLSEESGFKITKYSINVATSTKDNLSIGVEGQGDTDSFLKFLNDYKFKGGRLITNDQIDITSKDTNTVQLTLNFYNKTAPQEEVKNATLTSQDLQLIETIADKTSILKKNGDQIVEYPVKSNPF